MPTTYLQSDIESISQSLRFLSDPNRLRIVLALTRAESCVCDLIDELGLAQPLVSYHLAKLRKAGWVRHRREAQWVYYSLDPDTWRTVVAPLAPLLETAALPPAAAMGASQRCDLMPPDPEHGACIDDSCSCN